MYIMYDLYTQMRCDRVIFNKTTPNLRRMIPDQSVTHFNRFRPIDHRRKCLKNITK